ncbi:hypothetical protein GCM10023331_36460 [Algivirga pacifica]|uniref:TonB C-terminal domain-containing protein n=2 Tax=Algivirga pacifica TaxID=1162670 RepID=A0ABP9DNL6_9BACT
MAFEWKTYDKPERSAQMMRQSENEELFDKAPLFEIIKPKPQPVTSPRIQEVDDETELEDIEFEMPELDPDEAVEEIFEEPAEEIVEDDIVDFVEVEASPRQGLGKFYQWVARNMKYPNQARRMGVEGKVFVSFVVDRQGNITDVKVLRGIGAGCDEEAARVIRKSPQWNPGRVRGRAVKSRRIIPIFFKLG